MTAADGWRGTVRSIRWSPLLVTPLVSCAALAVIRALADPGPGRMALVGEAGLAFTASVSAFMVDDPTVGTAPATPTEAPARFVARAALIAPVVVLEWLVVRAVYRSLVPPAVAAGVGPALAGLGLATTALALAALSGRSPAVVSPGAVGVGAMTALGVLSHVVPTGWLQGLPPAKVSWPLAIVLALVAVRVALSEPRR